MNLLENSRMHTCILCVVIVGLILSCGCISESALSENTVPTEDTPLPSPPVEISAGMQDIVTTGLETTKVPGLLIEISTPEWIWNYAAGNASVSPPVPAEPDMRFIIASVTKSVTSTAILKLSEEGKLSLDDPIDQWLPTEITEKIPYSSRITIRQLLDHTSGIADYNEEEIIRTEYAKPDLPVPYQYRMWQGINASPLFEPGLDYEYSNVNYILLTLIIDQAAQTPYEDYITRAILVPAGMNQTFIHRTNSIPGPHMGCPGEEYVDGELPDFSNLYIQFDRGAGDIVSTPSDMNRFHLLLEDGKIIRPESLQEMKTINKMAYGLGYGCISNTSMNVTLWGHAGGYPGSYTMWYYWEEEDTALTINLNSLGDMGTANREILVPLLSYIQQQE